MSLRLRWTLALALISLAFVVAVGVVLEVALRAQERRETQRWRSARENELAMRLELLGRHAQDQLQQLLASREMNALLSPVASGAPAGEREVVDWAGLNAPRFGLDQLLVLDGGGRVLTNALWPASYGQVHPRAVFLTGCLPGAPVLWSAWTRESAASRVLGGVATVRLGGTRFLVAGGTLLDESGLARLAALADVTSLHWGPPLPGEMRLQLPGSWQLDGDVGLSLGVGAPPSTGILHTLRRQLALLALAVLLLSLAMAPLLAAGLARPLTRLAHAVEEVGRGRRQLDLPRGGPREIRELSHALRAMAGGLEAAEVRIRAAERRGAWQDIARRIAHEIRNVLSPLTLALDNVETAVERDDDDARRVLRTSLDTARDQLQSLERLVREFHAFARTPQLSVAQLDPQALCEAALAGARQARPGQPFQLLPAADVLPVEGDAEQLRRALHNLLLNAAEAAPGKPVELEWGGQPSARRWWMAVRDRGPGLDPGVASRLGEPYVTTKERGTGLGLAVVRQVAQAHGGALRWQSRDDGGLEMRLFLPQKVAAEHAAREDREERP